MTYRKKFIEKQLMGKFKFDQDEKGDHVRYKTLIDGLIITTKLSHGLKGDVDDWLESQISKQLKIDRQTFRGMMDCTVSDDAYRALIRRRIAQDASSIGDISPQKNQEELTAPKSKRRIRRKRHGD